jgi:4-aminobutyrate aminotransferase-like enzyme
VNCGVSTIRMMPPLVITRDLVDASLEIFLECLGEVEAGA